MSISPHSKSIYTPRNDKPMNVVVFVSGGGGNLMAAINLSLQKPQLLKVGLVVANRLHIKAIEIAKEYNIPVIASDFEDMCGNWNECKFDVKKTEMYQNKAILYHDTILEQILHMNDKLDLAVLSYHRWIQGSLLDYFADRMINQHAGDLTVKDPTNQNERKYIGINPVLYALEKGEKRTRTSTIMVRNGKDNGEILCQGPWVEYTGKIPVTKQSAWEHEVIQKRQSDWPSLSYALEHIANGNFGISDNQRHQDGSKIITFKGHPLPYGGADLANTI